MSPKYFAQNAARALLVTLLISLTVLAAGLILLCLTGRQLLSVQTASMTPVLRPGDAVLTARTKLAQLHVGDIVSYRSPRSGRMVISHRIVAIDRRTGAITTAGDRLRSRDDPFSAQSVIGRDSAVLAGAGNVLDDMHRPVAVIAGVYLPALALVASEMSRLARYWGVVTYRVPGRPLVKQI